MPSSIEDFWDPNEWEAFVFALLQDRHGPLNVQKVPARHRGDHGIDYLCLSEGVVYQCYAVTEPCEVRSRAANQIRKITKDLKKFCADSAPLRALFQNHKIVRWVLVVPLHDSSSVNQHLSDRTAAVRALGLSYVATDFEVHIQGLDAFPATSKMLRLQYQNEVVLTAHPPSPTEVEVWSGSQNELVQNLLRKLRKRLGATPSVDASRVIGWFLEWENLSEDLRESAPPLHETVQGVIDRETNRLEFSGPPEGTAQRVLREAVDDLATTLRNQVPNLSADSAEKMALGTVADWLLRCPLDIPPYDNAS